MITIRPAEARDGRRYLVDPRADPARWRGPMRCRQHWSRAEALGFWRGGSHAVFRGGVAGGHRRCGRTAASSEPIFLQPKPGGRGVPMSPIAATPRFAQARGRGIGPRPCAYTRSTLRGSRATAPCSSTSSSQPTRVQSRLWRSLGFEVVGRVPQAFPPSGARIGRRAGDVPVVVRKSQGKKSKWPGLIPAIRASLNTSKNYRAMAGDLGLALLGLAVGDLRARTAQRHGDFVPLGSRLDVRRIRSGDRAVQSVLLAVSVDPMPDGTGIAVGRGDVDRLSVAIASDPRGCRRAWSCPHGP